MSMEVTIDDLRRLLGSTLPEPVLVLVGGRLHVRSAAEDGDGAISVVTVPELRARLDGEPEPTDRDLELVAATLTTTIVHRGA